jgi:hypothetical protein
MKMNFLSFLLLFLILTQMSVKSKPQSPVNMGSILALPTAGQPTNNPSLEQLPSLNSLDPLILVKGIDEMKKHKVIIAGITRNNASDLGITIKTIEYIGSFFADYHVIVFENDSNDGTKEKLSAWKTLNSRINIISENYNIQKRPSIKFLAEARNKYIRVIQSGQYNDFDIVLVIDMDMSYGLDVRGIQDSFAKIDGWDGICSNGIFKNTGEMYDAFAFRNSEFPLPFPNEIYATVNDTLSKIQKIYPVGSSLVPVYSCFGGMAIYKRASIANCEYDSINEDCEHVAFHQCAINKNRMRLFMNPNQMIRYSHYK